MFLSHYQRTGGNLALALKMLLLEQCPTLKIFLDVDDLEDLQDLMQNVVDSANIILLLTDGTMFTDLS